MDKKTPKRTLVLLFILILFLFISLIADAILAYSTKPSLFRISRNHDPFSMNLEQGYNSYVERTFLIEDKVELGIIHMKDGSYSKYWFKSHHVTDDTGGTWFEMSNGKKMYMAGYFCCEATFPEKQFEDLVELQSFVKEHHKTRP